MAEKDETDPGVYLRPTACIDADNDAIRLFAAEHTCAVRGQVDRAIALYYAVRDGLRYDPYSIDVSVSGLRASTTLASGRGWCVSKAILLAACCRCLDIPARLGYADVRNHLSTEQLRERMGTDLFIWHGYTSIHLNGQWVKATPAFNIELCEKFRIRTLEFDGRADSIYHPYDLEGRLHMEYVRFRGEFADVPLGEMSSAFQTAYPKLHKAMIEGDFERDVDRETASL